MSLQKLVLFKYLAILKTYFLNHWCSFWSFGLGQSFVFFCVFHCFLCLFVRHRNRFIFYLILMEKSKSSPLSESVVLKQLALLISRRRSKYITVSVVSFISSLIRDHLGNYHIICSKPL